MKKPSECQSCPFARFSTGFVADQVPDKILFAVMLKMPGKNELIFNSPMTGGSGKYWEKNILQPLGIDRKALYIGNVIRCYPNTSLFPTGKLKASATLTCRQWDRALEAWRPTMYGITYNPANIFRERNTEKFIIRAFERALDLSTQHRVLLLCGEEAKSLFAPHLEGGLKKWQRHFWKVS